MDLATRIEKTSFLGYELLAWLAARSQLEMGVLTDEKDATLELWFEKRIVLVERDTPNEQTLIRSDEPVGTFEAKTALRLGKWIRQAQIAIIHNDQEWSFTVNADDLSLKGVRVKTELKPGEDGVIYDRVAAIEDLLYLWDQIYTAFLKLRMDPDAWSGELARIGKWIFE